MADLEYNESTKKVSFSENSLARLSEEDRRSAEETASLINVIMTNLVNHQGENPPLEAFTPNISVSASKLAKSGIEALQKNKPQDAVKLLSTALEMVLRRPIWESTIRFLEEVSQCLMPRCDAYVALKQWADAYADASLLMLMKPQDHLNYYRKGMILVSAGRIEEAQNLLKTALSLSPNNPLYVQALKATVPGAPKA